MKITGPNLMGGVRLSPELQKAVKNGGVQKEDKASFSDMLKDKIQEVDKTQKVADEAVMNFATGKSKNIHEAVLAMEMADTSLRMAVSVRNKVIEAYQEIMRMPV